MRPCTSLPPTYPCTVQQTHNTYQKYKKMNEQDEFALQRKVWIRKYSLSVSLPFRFKCSKYSREEFPGQPKLGKILSFLFFSFLLSLRTSLTLFLPPSSLSHSPLLALNRLLLPPPPSTQALLLFTSLSPTFSLLALYGLKLHYQLFSLSLIP